MGLLYNVGTYIKWVEVRLCSTKILFKKKIKPNNKVSFSPRGLEMDERHVLLPLLHKDDSILKKPLSDWRAVVCSCIFL